MEELEKRICLLLREGDSGSSFEKILNLSDRDAARILQRMDELENNDVFLLQPLIEEKRERVIEVKKIESSLQSGIATDSERDIFDFLNMKYLEPHQRSIGSK